MLDSVLWRLSIPFVSTTVIEVSPSLACNSDGNLEIKTSPRVGICYALYHLVRVFAPRLSTLPAEIGEKQMFLVDAVFGNSIGMMWLHKCPSLPTEIPPTIPRSQLRFGSQIDCLIFES